MQPFHVQQITELCLNSGISSPSLDEQLCGDYIDKILVNRWHSVSGTHIGIDSSKLQNCCNYRTSLFSPERLFPSEFHVGCLAQFNIPYTSRARYCNIIIQDQDHMLLYGRSVLLHPSNPLFFDSKMIKSHIYGSGACFSVNNHSLNFSIKTTNPEILILLQNEVDSFELDPKIDSENNVKLIFQEISTLSDGIWMLCCSDYEKKFIAQVCFEKWY